MQNTEAKVGISQCGIASADLINLDTDDLVDSYEQEPSSSFSHFFCNILVNNCGVVPEVN